MSRFTLFTGLALVLCSHAVCAQSGSAGEHNEAFRLFIEGAPIEEALKHQAKCGLPFIAEVNARWDNLTETQQSEFLGVFGGPATHTSTVSPKGYFRIHYDTSGVHAPVIPGYIDSVGAAFDYSYEFHINVLGYESPEPYGTFDPEKGDTIRYNVYVQNLPNLYGYTNWYGDRLNDDDDPVPRYRTFIVIDNEYDHTPTTGIDGLRVTAAHELHHAIQIGSYGNWLVLDVERPVRFFYEITSTWLEDVVYPEINDYYNYLPTIFSGSVYLFPFTSGSGFVMYGRAIWGHMMDRRYGRDIMREKWEYIRERHPVDAIDRALRDHGSTIEQELAEFHLWKFYTGSRARPAEYFPDGADYPTLALKSRPSTDTLMTHINETMIGDYDLSTMTLHFEALMTADRDTVYFLIGNVENRIDDQGYYELWVYSRERPNTIPVGNGMWYNLESNDRSAWKVIPLYTEQVVSDRRVSLYPNPFVTSRAASVAFVIDTEEDVELTILSTDMRLVFRDTLDPERSFGRTVYRWDGRDNRNRRVASGVYVYVLQYGDTVSTGKLTVIRN